MIEIAKIDRSREGGCQGCDTDFPTLFKFSLFNPTDGKVSVNTSHWRTCPRCTASIGNVIRAHAAVDGTDLDTLLAEQDRFDGRTAPAV